MPESEPKPKLIELVAPGAGQGWKAVLRNGKAAVVHEINAPAPEAAAAVPRIQRLAEHRHPALAPVLAWGTETNGIWVAVEPNEGVPLGTILSRGPLTPPAAAALGAAVLSGVAALHEAGIAMGGFGASAVRVTGNGEVRLTGHPAAAVRGAPSQSDLRADVRSCGMAICAAFGVDPAGAPAPPSIPPGLVVTMRSMASGAMGPAADRAQGALREMASALLAPDRMTAAQSELALRAGGREMPSITPFLPKETYPPAPAPAQPQQPPAPAPFVRPAPDETPVRSAASYEAPPRPADTYPPMAAPPPYVPPPRPEEPAPDVFPVVAPPIEAPPVPRPPVPTWDAEPAASSPAVASPEPAQSTWDAPVPSPAAPVAPPTPAAPAWEPAPATSTWEGAPAVETPSATTPSPAEPSAETAPVPPPGDARSTWTAIPTPVWTPAAEPEPTSTPSSPATPAPTPPAATPPAPEPVAPAYAPGYAASAAAATATRVPAPAPARTPAPRRPVYEQVSERPRWLVPGIAAVLVLLLIIVGGGILLSHRGGSNNVATSSPKTSPKTSPKATSSPSPVGVPLAIPNFGSASNPPVTSVEFLPDATCTLTSCRVDVEMKYSKAQGGDLGYTLKFFDRCTGTTTDLPGRHFTPPVPFIRADPGFQTVTLPSAKSAALVAVSTTPAVAASAPMLLGADTCA